MMETADSVRQYGILVPAIARPDPEGGYELVAGHRRHRASELAEKETMPVIVRDLDDDAATIIMVDSNLQRESLLPSERAFAYKMKLEAMKHQGARGDLTSSQLGTKLRADELLAQQAGSSRNQVQRYIRLTELIPELLDMVDEKKIAFNPAYELSFLKKEEQVDLLDAMDSEQATPSLSQAQRLKKYSQEGHLTLDMMRVIMGEEKLYVPWYEFPKPEFTAMSGSVAVALNGSTHSTGFFETANGEETIESDVNTGVTGNSGNTGTVTVSGVATANNALAGGGTFGITYNITIP